MIIVLDNTRVIESNWAMGGTRISDFKTRLTEIITTKAALNAINDPLPEGKAKGFVIRRWYTAE